MRKSLLTVGIASLLILAIHLPVRSQQSRVADRQAEWDRWLLPQSTFTRQTDSSKWVLFRVPSEWKQQLPTELTFVGPYSTTLRVVVEEISEGITLQNYVTAIVHSLSSTLEPDSIMVRGTTMSGQAAREIVFETDEDSLEVSRRIIWCTVTPSKAISLVLVTPVANIAEMEPYFKAVVQSVTLFGEFEGAGFEGLRASLFKESKPERVDEIQILATSLAALDSASRQANLEELTTRFSTSPESAIDLVLDHRPIVRAAVFEAIGRSQNSSLHKFLVRALADRETFVAEQAARSIAGKPDVIDLLRGDTVGWVAIQPLARVWPFLTKDKKIKILEEIFAKPISPKSNLASKSAPSGNTRSKQEVTVNVKVLPPGFSPTTELIQFNHPSLHLNALTLILDLQASEFKLPFDTILAARNDHLTTLALDLAWKRNESLPVVELLKLLAAANHTVRQLAALNLGESATIAELPKIEGFIKNPTTEKVSEKENQADDPERVFNDNLKLAISMIRFRDQLAKANVAERQSIIKAGLSDAKLADWVWSRYVRQAAGESKMARAQIRPLGENLFPPEVIHYTALPHPANALFALGRALDGLQLESARSQANLVLVLNVLRQKLGEELNAPIGAALLPYTGINVDKPIAMARWLAEDAPAGINSAERSAIVLRVTDRTRFERTLMRFHQGSGNIENLTNYFSGSVRFLPFLPAFLPLSAKALVDGALKPEKEKPLLKYSTVGETALGGYSVKVVERRKVDEHGRIVREAAYFTYVDDTAILTPDLESLRDVLSRASREQPNLGSNPNFNRVKGENAEAFYISNIMLLSADPGDKPLPENEIVRENGVLRVTNATWENHFELQFAETDWLKPFVEFQPEELKSPRELLPRNTVAYYLMNFDLRQAWNEWWPKRLKEDELKQLDSIWSLDFEKEVLPELGPECGLAVLGLPDILQDEWEPPWAVFCRLKSEKLSRALAEGKLLRGATGSQPTVIKQNSEDYFVAVQHNFLVFANSRKAISEMNQAEKLASSRDFSRAAKRAPAGMVAFGGYSLEAAVAAIGDPGTDAVKAHQSAFISSLTSAFHSPNFYATATNKSISGRLSLSMDREGRFSVSELASISNEAQLTFAQIEARGVPIQEQTKLTNLKLRVRVKAAGGIDRIGEDLNAKTQVVKKLSDRELELTVFPRRTEVKDALALPIKGPEFASFLQPSAEIRSDDKAVIEKAQSIVGNETDAWTVARKLADWTYKNIKWKVVDYATAPQTLATLEADCLEFSQLYVAMARSLGLPARVVSGMAYSGSFFGGHAWVEVYVGQWIEVDPTWGTDFVDATHIRNFANGELLTYAALNLVELEVLEAPTGVADFQKDVRSLAQKLCEELPNGVSTALTAAVDFALLANANSELGPWEKLSDSERDLMTTSFRRVIESISSEFSKAATGANRLRLLAVKEDGEKAEALVFQPGFAEELLKFSFVKTNGAWYLSEILRPDSGLYLIAEALQPTIKNLVERRTNKAARFQRTSIAVRILKIMRTDVAASLTLVDRALKDNPNDQGLRHLKAMALAASEKADEAIKLWQELANDAKPFAPALLQLADMHWDVEAPEKMKQAAEYYVRYGRLEPEDPRTPVALARLYEVLKDDPAAEIQHRAALKADPEDEGQYVEFAAFLSKRKRFAEAMAVLDEVPNPDQEGNDLFGDLLRDLYYSNEKEMLEELAQSQRQRTERSAVANLYLGYVFSENGKSLQAIPLFKKAAAARKDWSEPHEAMAQSYRILRNWRAAIKAADTAIAIQEDSSNAHFHRACALARLGRTKDAMQSLEKAVELDPELREYLAEESDLKILATRSAFKKLLVVPAEQ